MVVKNNYQARPYVHKIHSVMFKADGKILNDGERLEKILSEAAELEKYKIVAQVKYIHKPQGVSSIVVIEESYLAGQTWPDKGFESVVIDISSCAGLPLKAFDHILRRLKPEKFTYKDEIIAVKEEFVKEKLHDFNEETLEKKLYLNPKKDIAEKTP